MVRLLQISDPHLYAEEDGRLLGVRTADSFNAVIKAIVDQKLSFDLVLATGDLSQDYSTGSYQRFAQAVSPLAKPLFWLPGNHDDGPLMRNVMPEVGISNARQILLPHWQIIMLDTQVYGCRTAGSSRINWAFWSSAWSHSRIVSPSSACTITATRWAAAGWISMT